MMPISDPRERFFYPHHTYMKDYKYLSCVYGVDRKSVTRVTDRHHEACRVMPNSDPE